MAIIFQYNKTSLQYLQKQMDTRLKALPVLKNKESALRLEVKKAKNEIHDIDLVLESEKSKLREMAGLWQDFDMSLIQVENVIVESTMLAGVKIPKPADIHFKIKNFGLFSKPHWYGDGIEILKNLSSIVIDKEFLTRKMLLLDKARKKTTQKVNLYEKNQIPEYDQAIKKIKRFMEDEENLAKSSQKILKNKLQNTTES
ncbi:MAG: V-type ATP synthase subunit D [Saprospiraceae bacterium]|jgi:V/A-type H+-transporting ATPase subunit D|nr:V-type ATP synthase subunit D [Saprospiraceae bacterium]